MARRRLLVYDIGRRTGSCSVARVQSRLCCRSRLGVLPPCRYLHVTRCGDDHCLVFELIISRSEVPYVDLSFGAC